MSDQIIEIKGLQTSANNLSATEPGSLRLAVNVVLDNDNLGEIRRGFTASAPMDGGSGRAKDLFVYQDKLFSLSNTNQLRYLDSGIWNSTNLLTQSGTLDYAQANKNLYITSDTSLQKLDSFNATLTQAGVPTALAMEGSLVDTLGFLGDSQTVAYRLLWFKKDENSNLVQGGVSDRFTITNRDGVKEVTEITVNKTGSQLEITPTGPAQHFSISTPSRTYYVWFKVVDGNSHEEQDPSLSGKTPIQVDVHEADTADTIANLVESSLSGVFDVVRSGPTLTITNKKAGSSLDAADGSTATGFTISTTTQGSDESRNVSITVPIPESITTSHGYQLYRSNVIDDPATPSDELQLVYEGNPTPAEITAKSLTITDITPDELKGAFIYTAQSQEGLAATNQPIPSSKSIEVFQGTTFLGNVNHNHKSFLTLLAVGAPSGLQIDDTITLGTETYTAKASTNTVSKEFQLVSSGSAAQNIADTAAQLVKTINAGSAEYQAFYLSDDDSLPGKVLVQKRSVAGAGFATSTTRVTAWNISNPQSDSGELPNQIWYSKLNQPEHFTLAQTFFVGNGEIKKLVALKESLIAFCTDGIYRISGAFPFFSVELLDSSSILIGNTTAVLNNEIMCLSTQGIVRVNGNGVKIVSRDIEDQILPIIKANKSTLEDKSYGWGSELDRRYYLSIPSTLGSSTNDNIFVFHLFTNAWTTWDLKAATGTIYQEKIYLASNTSNHILEQKNTQTPTDYLDDWESITVSITQVFSDSVTITEPTTGLNVGDVLVQGEKEVHITQVDGQRVYLNSVTGFTTGAASHNKAICVQFAFNPIFASGPGTYHQYVSGILHFKGGLSGQATLSTKTDISPVAESSILENTSNRAWGDGAWGVGPWAGSETYNERFWLNGTRGAQLFVSFIQCWANAPLGLQGFTLKSRSMKTNRTRR